MLEVALLYICQEPIKYLRYIHGIYPLLHPPLSFLTLLQEAYAMMKMRKKMPASLTKLVLQSNSFNHPLDRLPPSLTDLSLDTISFDHELRSESLPNITHLNLEYYHRNVNDLPHKHSHLTFGHEFDSPITKFSPNITHLSFGDPFNKPVDPLPPLLIHLSFGHCSSSN